MHNRFQGNHGAKVWWVALEKAIVFLPVITLKSQLSSKDVLTSIVAPIQ